MPRTKLTAEDVEAIRTEVATGLFFKEVADHFTFTNIAKRYGIHRNTVYNVVTHTHTAVICPEVDELATQTRGRKW